MPKDPYARMRRGAGRIQGGLSSLFGRKKKSIPSSPRKRTRRRRKVKVGGSEAYRDFLKRRLQ